MRLAFSVAINVDADILLIDEILGVGDANFQAKCFNKLREIKAQGTTIVIVSHSLGQIEQICERSIWIKDGLIEMEGKPQEVHLQYLNYMNEERISQQEKERIRQQKKEADDRKKQQEEEERRKKEEEIKRMRQEEWDNNTRYGSGDIMFTSLELCDVNDHDVSTYKTGDTMTLKAKYKMNKPVQDVVFGIGVFRNDDLWCYGTNTKIERFEKFDVNRDGEYDITFTDLNLIPGQYWMNVSIEYGADGAPIDFYKQAIRFEVVSNVG